MKKIEFSKKWLIGCVAFSAAATITSYILSGLDKNPVSELSIAVIEACWGTSGVSFVGYALQNCVRAFTAAKFGIPKEDIPEAPKDVMPPELKKTLKKFLEEDES